MQVIVQETPAQPIKEIQAQLDIGKMLVVAVVDGAVPEVPLALVVQATE
jgi:hypothetical protein